MRTEALYLLEVVACSGILLLLYGLLLDRRVSYGWCRVYLISSVVISALIPALRIPLWPAPSVAPVVAEAMPLLPEDISETAAVRAPSLFSPEHICWAIYAVGCLLILASIVRQMLIVWRLRRGAELTQWNGIEVVRTSKSIASFSLFRTVYIGRDIAEEDLLAVLAHECSHIRRAHSVERIAMEMLKALLWWNPFVWVASRKLVEVEEFEADRDVLCGGYDTRAYMDVIFRQLFGYSPDIANGFHHSLTKKRFQMMTLQISGNHGLLRVAATVPVVLGLMCLFGTTARAATSETAENPPQEAAVSAIYLLNDREVTYDEFARYEVADSSATFSDERIPAAYRDREIDFLYVKYASKPELLPRVRIEGQVTYPDGKPVSEAYVYACVDASQIPWTTSDRAKHFVKSDANGRYSIEAPIAGIFCVADKDKTAVTMRSYKYTDSGTHYENFCLLYPDSTKKRTIDSNSGVTNNDEPETARSVSVKSRTVDDDAPFLIAETMPTFEGGDLNDFRTWVGTQVRYPAVAAANHLKGRVVVTFVIERDGTLSNIVFLQTPDQSFSDEVTRVLRESPKWTPGRQRGEVVRVKYTLPVDFQPATADATTTSEIASTAASETAVRASTKSDGPFLIAETMPRFGDGDLNDFRTWVNAQVHYPAVAAANHLKGRVVVSFVVEKDGTLGDIKILHTPDQSFSDEVIRVLQESPKWTPGRQRGEVVCVKYTLPVDFGLTPTTK